MKVKQIPKSHEVWVYLRDGVVEEIKAYRVTGNFKSLDEITTTNITSSIAEHDIKKPYDISKHIRKNFPGCVATITHRASGAAKWQSP